MDCKRLLNQAKGDLDKAVELFRKEGKKVALKKQDRGTNQGVVEAYIHPGSKVGVLLEINCETDFVARNAEFKQLAHDLAMHIAAFDPKYIGSADVAPEELTKEKAVYQEQLAKGKKPAAVKEKIIAGKLEKFYAEVCLLKQPFLKDDKQNVEEYLQEKIAKIGENIKIKRFARFSL